MADKEQQADTPAYRSLDRKGTWFLSKASFPMEDPTAVHEQGKGAVMSRFEAGAFTQATSTAWTEGQWKAGVLVKYTGDPRDEGSEAVVYEEPAAAPALMPADIKDADKKAADAKAADAKK